MRFTVDRIDHIVLNVKDVEISTAWYMRVLGMERDFGPNSHHRPSPAARDRVRPADTVRAG
jgi:catechol 2,3-dioxygenase-like lactoylglutathione lyase family enzyme